MVKMTVRKILTALCLTIAAAAIACSAPHRGVVASTGDSCGEFSPTTVIVMVDSVVGKEPLRDAVAHCGATIIYDYRIIPGMAIAKPETMTLDETIDYFRRVEGVVSVERDRIIRLTDPVRPPTLSR